jgi:hypothetical protein
MQPRKIWNENFWKKSILKFEMKILFLKFELKINSWPYHEGNEKLWKKIIFEIRDEIFCFWNLKNVAMKWFFEIFHLC